MNEERMAIVRSHLEMQREATKRQRARHEKRKQKLENESPLIPKGIAYGYHDELVWSRLDLKLAAEAILDAVQSGYSDGELVQKYAAAQAAVERSTAQHAYLRLINDSVLKIGRNLAQVLPGPNFTSESTPALIESL